MASRSQGYNGGILKKCPKIRKSVEIQTDKSLFGTSPESEDGFMPMRRSHSSPELLASSAIMDSGIMNGPQKVTVHEDLILRTIPTVHLDSKTTTPSTHSEGRKPSVTSIPVPSLPALDSPTSEREDNYIPRILITPVPSAQRSRFKSDLESYTYSTPGNDDMDPHDDEFFDGLSEDEDDDESAYAHRKKNYRRSSAAFIVQENQSLNRNGRRRKAMLGGCCWCSFTSLDKPSWNRISAFIVRNAPCFWCCGERIETSITNRMIVMRLNILCLFFALIQVASGFFLFYLTCLTKPARRDITDKTKYWREALIPNLWTPSGSITLLALVGLAIIMTILLSRRSIQQFNLKGSIRYLWALYWLIPLEIFLVISLVDYHQVTNVWVDFWWPTASMAWFRQIFCYGNTADTSCRDAIKCTQGDVACDDIRSIRSHATKLMVRSSYTFFYSNAAVGLVLILLVRLFLYCPFVFVFESAFNHFNSL